MTNRFEVNIIVKRTIIFVGRFKTLVEANKVKQKIVKNKGITLNNMRIDIDNENDISVYEHKTAKELEQGFYDCRLYRLALMEAKRRRIPNPNEADIFELMSEIIARANEREIQV